MYGFCGYRMENFVTKVLLVIGLAVIVSAQIINKLDVRNAALDELQRLIWYRRKDMIEIRELILTIPFFQAIGGEDEEKYFTKFNDWYVANKNTLHQRRRDLESLEEKVNVSFSYSDSTAKTIKNLTESDVSATLRLLQSLEPRWKSLADRVASLEEIVMAVRGVADKTSKDVDSDKKKYSQSYQDFLDVKVILENELEVANNRTLDIDGLEYRLQQVDNRLSNIKTKADTIMSGGTECRQKIGSIKERIIATENEIKEVVRKIEFLKIGGSPAVGSGVNYIKSVKTASGSGKRIKLVVLSD